jgi:hypothetical protein
MAQTACHLLQPRGEWDVVGIAGSSRSHFWYRRWSRRARRWAFLALLTRRFAHAFTGRPVSSVSPHSSPIIMRAFFHVRADASTPAKYSTIMSFVMFMVGRRREITLLWRRFSARPIFALTNGNRLGTMSARISAPPASGKSTVTGASRLSRRSNWSKNLTLCPCSRAAA